MNPRSKRRPPSTPPAPPPRQSEPSLLHRRMYFQHRSAGITRPTGAIEVIDLNDDTEMTGEQRARNVLLQGYIASANMLGIAGDPS